MELLDDEYTPEERVNIFVYEKCNRSVVNINTKGTAGTALFVIEIPSEGAGSGSVLDKRGHILTNYHVVEDAREIQVTLFDGKNYDAHLVGRDPVSDVAVIKIDAPPESLYPVTLGDSSRLKVGQRVFAIGNPFGLERTLTTGIISSLNRELPTRNSRTIKSIIQIDAAINPGNSGGPLLDTHGRADRHEHGHRQQDRTEHRRRLRHSGQHHRPRRAATDREGQGHAAGDRHRARLSDRGRPADRHARPRRSGGASRPARLQDRAADRSAAARSSTRRSRSIATRPT